MANGQPRDALCAVGFLNGTRWDPQGNPNTIDSVGLIYGDLGRMVEQNRSGVYTQMAGWRRPFFSGAVLQRAPSAM